MLSSQVTISLPQYPPCPICESKLSRLVFTRDRYNVHECEACTARFLYPQPDDATLAAIYTADYFLGSGDSAAAARVEELKRATARVYLDMLADSVTPIGKNLLEVGCGKGEFLLEAQSRGYEVAGVEYAALAAARANAALGRDVVRVGELHSARFNEQSFDAVVFCDVIEHVRDPVRFVREVRRLLRPGGWMLLVTPSLDSWSARLMGRYWMEYKVEHLFYFSRKSIRQLLEGCGFDSLRAEPNVKVLNFDYIARHFAKFHTPLVSPAVGLLRALTPDRLAHRHISIVASGVLFLARRADD